MTDTKTASTQPEKVLELVEVMGAVMEKSSALLTQKEAQDADCAKLIPLAVDALLKNERIEPHETKEAAQVLADPVKVLEILIKTAQHRNDAERAQLGKPEKQTKQASYNSLNDNYVGRRSRPGESAADAALKRGLGL